MTQTRYGFSDAINGFYEISTDTARGLLPSQLEPLEAHHGRSILCCTAFAFTESEVGPYGEVVLSIIVAPLLRGDEIMPRAAMYPFIVGTSTKASRDHAIERWHLPHWMEEMSIQLVQDEEAMEARVAVGGTPVLESRIYAHQWEQVGHRYQSFMADDAGRYMARMLLEGEFSEHEEGKGWLKLHDHPFNKGLHDADMDEIPMRENWMRGGLQTFDPLVTL